MINFFKNLFGAKPTEPAASSPVPAKSSAKTPAATPASPATDPAKDPNLITRCLRITDPDCDSLSAPTAILDGVINLCLDTPKLLTTRLLLARTLASMRHARRELTPLYRDKIHKLQADFPLSSLAQQVCERLFNEAVAA